MSAGGREAENRKKGRCQDDEGGVGGDAANIVVSDIQSEDRTGSKEGRKIEW